MASTLQSRMNAYEKAWSSKDGNFGAVLEFFADNVDFSDYGTSPLTPCPMPCTTPSLALHPFHSLI